MTLEFKCPSCGEYTYVEDDWQYCLQRCDNCGSESEVNLVIESVNLKIERKYLGPTLGELLEDVHKKYEGKLED